MVDDSVDDAVEDDVCEGDATSKDPDNDETGLSFLFCCSSLDVEVEVVVLKEEVLVEEEWRSSSSGRPLFLSVFSDTSIKIKCKSGFEVSTRSGSVNYNIVCRYGVLQIQINY